MNSMNFIRFVLYPHRGYQLFRVYLYLFYLFAVPYTAAINKKREDNNPDLTFYQCDLHPNSQPVTECPYVIVIAAYVCARACV